jgi:drug/metabolite transporter superfamily protein YnfA
MGTLRWADLKLAALTSILVLAAYSGIVEGFNASHWARNLAESVTAAAQLGYGTLAFFALISILKKHRFARPLIEFWGAIFVATSIMSPVVLDNATIEKAILSGFVASLIVALIIWLWAGNQAAHVTRAIARPVARPIQTEKPAVTQQVIVPVDRWDRELAELKAKVREAEARPIAAVAALHAAVPLHSTQGASQFSP